MSLQLLAFKVNSYVIISQKNLPFSGTIEILNLQGNKALEKRVASVDRKDVLPAEYVKTLVRWKRLKFIVDAMR